MSETKDFEPGQVVWVMLAWAGPVKAVFVKDYPRAKKALVEFSDTPQLVEPPDLFADRAECYRHAAAKENVKALSAMQAAQKYLQQAVEPEKGA